MDGTNADVAIAAQEALMMQDAVKSAGDKRVRADDLASKHKGRRNKEERMASVLEGAHRLCTACSRT